MKVGQLEKNQNRNRFVDIIPYDDNYVSLQVSRISINSEATSFILFQKEQGLPSSTYVNASYVDDLEGVGKVIVTQVNNGKFLLSSHFFWAESKHLKGRLGPPVSHVTFFNHQVSWTPR